MVLIFNKKLWKNEIGQFSTGLGKLEDIGNSFHGKLIFSKNHAEGIENILEFGKIFLAEKIRKSPACRGFSFFRRNFANFSKLW